jgi:hypothetical protein
MRLEEARYQERIETIANAVGREDLAVHGIERDAARMDEIGAGAADDGARGDVAVVMNVPDADEAERSEPRQRRSPAIHHRRIAPGIVGRQVLDIWIEATYEINPDGGDGTNNPFETAQPLAIAACYNFPNVSSKA